MPRPGPRPYECVRRAWHSDRHQPIRGSLIQEIFRVVNEIHSPATKKNKEWQEKLPIVVLKAEEIMYSKANSETEYLDLKTLWDRVNDAIDTIIRRDETTEAGEFLQPCIEAALNLGCTPRRSSRSQRNSNPMCYLSSRTQDFPKNITQGDHKSVSGYMSSSLWNSSNPKAINAAYIAPKCQSNASPNNDCMSEKLPIAFQRVLPSDGQYFSCFPNANRLLVYPLYYGNISHFEGQHTGIGSPCKSTLVSLKSTGAEVVNNLNSGDAALSTEISHAETKFMPEHRRHGSCDLSLRLGPLPVPSQINEGGEVQIVKDVGSCSSQEQSKVYDPTLQVERVSHFPFWCKTNAPSQYYSSEWRFMGEKEVGVEATIKRRKTFRPLFGESFNEATPLGP